MCWQVLLLCVIGFDVTIAPMQATTNNQMGYVTMIKQQVVAYIRVSTGKQEASGLGIEAQHDYIKRACESNNWEVVATFQEAVSGAMLPTDRPQMAQAINLASTLNIPIVAAKIDRFSRDVEHMASLMKRVSLKVATMPTADNFQLHLFAALAEQERKFISQRTKDALKALQDRADSGCVESVAKVKRRAANAATARQAKSEKSEKVQTPKVNTHHKEIAPHVKACLFEGANTLQSLADCLNSKGKLTSRGGLWSPTTVARLMAAIGVSFSKGKAA